WRRSPCLRSGPAGCSSSGLRAITQHTPPPLRTQEEDPARFERRMIDTYVPAQSERLAKRQTPRDRYDGRVGTKTGCLTGANHEDANDIIQGNDMAGVGHAYAVPDGGRLD